MIRWQGETRFPTLKATSSSSSSKVRWERSERHPRGAERSSLQAESGPDSARWLDAMPRLNGWGEARRTGRLTGINQVSAARVSSGLQLQSSRRRRARREVKPQSGEVQRDSAKSRHTHSHSLSNETTHETSKKNGFTSEFYSAPMLLILSANESSWVEFGCSCKKKKILMFSDRNGAVQHRAVQSASDARIRGAAESKRNAANERKRIEEKRRKERNVAHIRERN